MRIAVEGSKEFYKDKKSNTPNPFFIGFGNPNSKILIFGKEKYIKMEEEKLYTDSTVNSESIQNPFQWQQIIDENINDFTYKFPSKTGFGNPLYPYNGGSTNKMGTWSYYQKLISIYYPQLKSEKTSNSFFKNTFISEINHEVSKKGLGNQRSTIRTQFLNHPFFISFPITIIAAGNYLKEKEIIGRFEVSFIENKSEPYKKIKIYKNIDSQRIVVDIRQLSDFRYTAVEVNEYFQKIINLIRKHKE